ncbi:MAG: flagellar basal body P-ring formation chaperone FlgA [Planctomycetota bacterium]
MKNVIYILFFSLATQALADSVRLYEQAGTAGPSIRLAEVAELEGEYAESLGDLIVARFSEGQGELSVQLATVRRVLSESGVNWAELSLRGRSVCVVTNMTADKADTKVSNDRAVTTNNKLAVDQENAGQTVSGMLIDEIVSLNGNAPIDDMKITFRGGADEAAWLNRSAAVGRYEVQSLSRSGLGRVPMKVRRYAPSGTVEEATLMAEVSRRIQAVVALRQVRRGEVFSRENAGVKEIYITSDQGETLSRGELVWGQPSGAAIREGAVVLTDHVAPDVLVKRGDLVTVACVSGSLVVRMVGRASENGGRGDIIAVRNPETRETFYATVSGRRQATISTDSSRDRLALQEDK